MRLKGADGCDGWSSSGSFDCGSRDEAARTSAQDDRGWGWALALVLFVLVGTGAGQTLERVRTAKALVCGVNSEEGDYSRSDDHGRRDAFERDLCKAVAVAVLGADAKTVVPLKPPAASTLPLGNTVRV